MKASVRHIATTAFILLLIAGLGMLHGCESKESSRRVCNGLDVRIPGKLEFVTKEDVAGMMDKGYGPYIGVRLDSLDLGKIEEMMLSKGIVKSCEAWTTRDGILHISVVQRVPKLMFKNGDDGYYIDSEGFTMPLHPTWTADVPVIEGNAPDLRDSSNREWGVGVLELMDWISSSKKWKDKIAKVSVNRDGDLVLNPVEGSERFIFGAPDAKEEKFARIEKYYSHIVPYKGEGYYKSVNLKYNKQIICRKDI